MRDPRSCHRGYMAISADGDKSPALYTHLSSFNAFNLATSLAGLHALPKKVTTVQILGMKPTYCNCLVHSPVTELTEL
jgi:hypothetical protein